jgi:hypothetical protein
MVLTNKQKFNKTHGFKRDESHSIADIAKKSKISKSILQQVFNRGVGARITNPESVRSLKDGKKRGGKSLAGKMSGEQWGMARVYGFVMKNPKQVAEGKPDNDLFKKIKK